MTNNNQENQSTVADEGTRLLRADSEPPANPSSPQTQQARDILLSTTLSRLGSRSWEFASPLLLLEWSPGSLTAPAVFGLANAFFCTVVGPVLGKRADRWDRFHTVLIGTGAQAVGCLVSIGALVLWNRSQQSAASDDEDGDALLSAHAWHFASLSIVVVAGIVEALGASLSTVAVKREWVPIVFNENNQATTGRQQQPSGDDANNNDEAASSWWKWQPRLTLSFMNTTMTNIDLLAAMFGPVLAGWIIQLLVPDSSSSMQRGFIVIALLNTFSFAPEALLLRRVYNSCSDLRHREAVAAQEKKDAAGTKNNTKKEAAVEDENSWKLWLIHPSGLQLLSISLASLYLTVLSPSSAVLTAYLVTVGLAPTSIGAFRAIGALSGVCGIGLFSIARHWGENENDSSSTNSRGNNEDTATTTTTTTAGHATAKSIEQLRRASSGFLLLEVVSVILAAVAFSRCDTPGMIAKHLEDSSIMSVIPVPLYAFLGFVCVSRAGLYSFDIGALEIEQHIVDERYRNAIGSVESAMCSLLWMMVFVMSILIPDPADFGIQVWVSAAAVTFGWMCFVSFLVLYLNHGHYHHDDEEEGDPQHHDDGHDGHAHSHSHHGHGHGHCHSHVHEHTIQQEKELRSSNGFHVHLHRHRSVCLS